MNNRVSARAQYLFKNTARLSAFVGCAVTCNAQLFVDLPDINLLPNTANQSFQLSIQNTGGALPVTGIFFSIQVEDGGPEAFDDYGGSIDGPGISYADVTSIGTIFAADNDGNQGGSAYPQVFEAFTTSADPVNIPSGFSPLATVTFDTTGFQSGSFTYTLDTISGPLTFLTTGDDILPALASGTLTVVPEPSHYAMMAGLVCLGWATVRRKMGRKTA